MELFTLRTKSVRFCSDRVASYVECWFVEALATQEEKVYYIVTRSHKEFEEMGFISGEMYPADFSMERTVHAFKLTNDNKGSEFP
jgi:hypothetical protein